MRYLVSIDSAQNKIVSYEQLQETDNIKYSIEDLPKIENKDGYIGQYALNSDGEIVVEYIELEPTENEKLQTRISELEEVVMQMSMDLMP